MRILIVDDKYPNRFAATWQLTRMGHEVVVASGYGEARDIAAKEEFDAAIVDLLMPAEPTTLCEDAITEHVGREIGAGFPLILALSRTINHICLATDTNDHYHPMSAIVDWVRGKYKVNDSTVAVCRTPLQSDGTKDYQLLLSYLLR